MSESGDEDYQDAHGDHGKEDSQRNKKRKIQRACDVCRRKKIRCDGPTMNDGKCTNCITYNYECTYVEIAKKRGPPKGYVESLENRLEKMENLLRRGPCLEPRHVFSDLLGHVHMYDEKMCPPRGHGQLCPGSDFSAELGPPIERNIWAKDPSAFPARAKALTGPLSSDPNPPTVGFTHGRDDVNGSSDDDPTDNPPFGNFSIASISNTMSNLNLGTGGHFYGRSSVFMHIQSAVDRKFEYLSTKMEGEPMPPIEELLHFRPEYWQPNSWELDHQPKRQLHEFEFPPNDLLDTLVNIYFLSNNCHFPLLHRPTFEQNYRSGLHESSAPFAEIVLLVCAIASRCCDDPRVLLNPAYPHSAGWKYYEQVNVTDRSLVMPPTLLDLQSYVLASWYLLESSCNYAAWALTGIGLRMAQDVGAHRKKVYRNPMAFEDESWKRAFWCLIAIDRLASSTMGRIPAIYDSDIDVELPLEVDDEYWAATDSQPAFTQPVDKPAQATAFVKLLKLSSIVAYALQTIYAVNKSQLKVVSGTTWEQQVLAEIDTMLSKWIDDLPPHLQWPNQGAEHPIFFTQSTSLYAIFYHTQIVVHHPFILTPKRPVPTTPFPSHQICVNAARSCSHVVDAYRKRSVYFAPWCVVGAMSAVVVLLENLWTAGTQYGPASVDVPGTMDDVQKCNDVIAIVERRWPAIGKMRDIVQFLAAADGASFPALDRTKPKSVAGTKRGRAGEGTKSGRGGKAAAPAPASTSPRVMALLPPIRMRNSRSASNPNGMPPAPPPAPPVGISPTDPRTMGPPPIDYTFPTTPAQWYGDSPHPDGSAPPSAGGAIQTPLGATNGNGADHGPGGYGYGPYPTGPGGPPPPHAQESFIRRDLGDGVAPMKGMPMWPGLPGAAPPGAQDYHWGAPDEWAYRPGGAEGEGQPQ